MRIQWLDPLTPDRRHVGGIVAVLEAARVADGRPGLTPTVAGYMGGLRSGYESDPPLVAVALDERNSGRGPDGPVRGVAELTLPPWDNTSLGLVEITVDPRARRRGIGRALYAAAVERIRSAGRTEVVADALRNSAGERFLGALGLAVEPADQQREQDVAAIDWTDLDAVYGDALVRAAGYEIREIPPVAPDELLGELIAVISAINDAPVDPRHAEPERYPPERIRAYEEGCDALGRTGYRLVTVHAASGEFAGYTGMAVDTERPWYGYQYVTSVRSGHRGHRLGLLLKIAMLRLLREREPALRTVGTWNSAENAHMIAVNERLGYRLVAEAVTGVGRV
jgi:GNAT superfamily N-acetyltransferase